jgi:tight adherence protein B
MNGITLAIIIALAVAMVGLAIAQIVANMLSPERRKLKARLSPTGAATQDMTAERKAILMQSQSVEGATGLLRIGFFNKLNRSLLQAFPETSMAKFLGIAAALGLGGFIVVGGFFMSLLLGGITGLVGFYLPFFVLGMKRNRRQRTIAEQLPEALEFLSRILKAGHSLPTGMQSMSEELPEPLAGEFRRCYDQHSLGQPMEDCLKEMSTRIGSTDFAFFVTAVLIQRQTGGDLSEVLTNISNMIRGRIRLAQSVKAKTAEGRFTGYILVALPAVLFFVAYALNPTYAGVLLKTTSGLQLLGTAIGLQVLGLFAIRKITTIKV